MLYYIYCIEMGRSESEFYHSNLGKVLSLINIHSKFKTGTVEQNNNDVEITSMKQIPGFM